MNSATAAKAAATTHRDRRCPYRPVRRIDETEQRAKMIMLAMVVTERHPIGQDDLEAASTDETVRGHVFRTQRFGKTRVHPDRYDGRDCCHEPKYQVPVSKNRTIWPVPGAMTGTTMKPS